MAADVDDRDLLLARRLKLGVRLLIYPLLLGLVAYAWHARSADGADDAGRWQGRSSQGGKVWATIDRRWLNAFGVDARLRCDRDVSDRKFTWTPSPDIVRQRGDQVTAYRPPTARPYDDGWSYRYSGRLRMTVGDHPHGVAWIRQVWMRGDRRVVCASGPVTFTLRRS